MIKRHRIFIAINLPEDVKRALAKFQEKWAELPCKWAQKDQLHITLEFLGNLTDQEVVEVCRITREVSGKHESFFVDFKKIIYGPPLRQGFAGQAPKMIWAEGEKSKELSKLKIDLQKSLLEAVRFTPETRVFSPHITLARIKEWEWKKIEPEEMPEVNEEINLTFTVESIEAMESELRRGGPAYTVLESCQLKD